MKRRIVTLGAALSFTFAFAGTAGAHQHYIETPTGKDVLLPLEPIHVHEGQHPLHNHLHLSPAADNRAVSAGVAVSDEDGGLTDRGTGEKVTPINVK